MGKNQKVSSLEWFLAKVFVWSNKGLILEYEPPKSGGYFLPIILILEVIGNFVQHIWVGLRQFVSIV